MKKQESNEKPEEILNDLLKEAEDKSGEIAEKGRHITKFGQNTEDLARSTRNVIQYYIPPHNLEVLIDHWSITNAQLDHLLSNIAYLVEPVVSSSTGTVAYSSTDIFNPSTIIPTLPYETQADALIAINNLHEVTSRIADKDAVIKLMQTFDLDQSSKGKKSCLDQFLAAHAAFENPVSCDDPISTSLIPMRESINIALSTLLLRRPNQEKAKSQLSKVISIGTQIKHDSISDANVQIWANQWKTLLDKYLSPSKQDKILRDDWQVRLQQSTLFMRGFLGGLDPNKMR